MLAEEQKVRIRELQKKGYSRNKVAEEMQISWDSVDKFWGEDEGKEKVPGDAMEGMDKGPASTIAAGPAKVGSELSLKEKYALFSRHAATKADVGVMRELLTERIKGWGLKKRVESRADLLMQKIEWVWTEVEKGVGSGEKGEEDLKQAQEIFEEITRECRELMGIEDLESLIPKIREKKQELDDVMAMIKGFEEEKGLTLPEARTFVEENRELITDWRAMKAEMVDWQAVRWKLDDLKLTSPELFHWKCNGCGNSNVSILNSRLVEAAEDGKFFKPSCVACGYKANFSAYKVALWMLYRTFDILERKIRI